MPRKTIVEQKKYKKGQGPAFHQNKMPRFSHLDNNFVATECRLQEVTVYSDGTEKQVIEVFLKKSAISD